MEMDKFDKSVYEQLLSDNSFIEWASGKDGGESNHWVNWKEENPEYIEEFEEAFRIASMLKFDPPAISEKEISYLWLKTKSGIEKIKEISPFQKALIWYGRIAGVLIIPLIVFSVWYFQHGKIVETGPAKAIETQKSRLVTVKAPPGGRLNFEFPDGSKVWLNSGSVIKYPVSFDDKYREVDLLGEAVFEIKKDRIPFVVHNSGPDVKVYGTVFCVNSYADNDDVIVALKEGKISLGANSTELFLKPGEVSFFNKSEKRIAIKKINDIDRYISWRDGKLIFRDTPLSEIVKTLQHNYNVQIRLSNSKIANYKYNATFENESLEQILYMLTLTAPVKYVYEKPELDESGVYTKARITILEDRNRVINQ